VPLGWTPVGKTAGGVTTSRKAQSVSRRDTAERTKIKKKMHVLRPGRGNGSLGESAETVKKGLGESLVY